MESKQGGGVLLCGGQKKRRYKMRQGLWDLLMVKSGNEISCPMQKKLKGKPKAGEQPVWTMLGVAAGSESSPDCVTC